MTWKIAQKITFLEILEVNNRNLNLSFLCHFTFEIYCTTFISYSENLLNPYFIGNYNTNYIVRIMVPWLGLIFFSYYLLFLIPAIGSSSLLPPMIWSKKHNFWNNSYNGYPQSSCLRRNCDNKLLYWRFSPLQKIMETIVKFFYWIILKVIFETSLVVDQTSTISYGTI